MTRYLPDEQFFTDSGYDLVFTHCPNCESMESCIAGKPQESVIEDTAVGVLMRMCVFGLICLRCDNHVRVVFEPSAKS